MSVVKMSFEVSREISSFQTLHASTVILMLHRDEARLQFLTNLIILYVYSYIIFILTSLMTVTKK